MKSRWIHILCFLSVASQAEGLDSNFLRVFALRSADNDQWKNCSATMFRDIDRCHIVSNAHCAPKNGSRMQLAVARSDSSSLFSSGAVLQTSSNFEQIAVSIQRYDAKRDLIEIKMPEGWDSQYCSQLRPLPERYKDTPGVSRAISYRARGYVMGHAAQRYSGNLVWEEGAMSPSYANIALMGDNFALLEINDLYVTPGMSGGPVDSNWEEAVGIISQIVLFQMRAYVVPMSEVQAFVRSPPSELPPQLAAVQLPRNSAMTAQHLTLRNDRDPVGSNSHGDGDDEWIRQRLDLRMQDSSPLAVFREPPEGVLDPNDSQQRIVAYGAEQIDGRDDFLIKPELSLKPADSKKWVKIKDQDYPEKKVRQKTLQRLDGFYMSLGSAAAGTDPVGGHRIAYLKNDAVPEGWESVLYGRPLIHIDLNSKKKLLIVDIFSHPVGHGLSQIQLEPEKLEYQIRFDEEAKRIELVSNHETLVCDNRYFLKLICIGPVTEFAFSLTNTQFRYSSFRIARLRNVNNQLLTDYIFGRIGKTREPKQWRNSRN